MQLHNKLSKEALKANLMNEPFNRITLSFYKYFKIAGNKSWISRVHWHQTL
jgi:hypothetical protein